jgi:ATP-dependent Zn protease
MKTWRKTRLGLTYVQLVCARFAFWSVVLMLILVVLRMILPGQPARVMEYGALVNNIDAGNVVSATFTTLKDGEEIRGELRAPAELFRTPISTDQIESLTTRLQIRGVKTGKAGDSPPNSIAYWGATVLAVLPFLAFLFLFRILIKRLKRKLIELRIKEAT